MWLAIKALLLRWVLARSFGGLVSFLLLLAVPLAGVLKVVGLPLLIVVGIVGLPILLVLAVIGLPILLVVGSHGYGRVHEALGGSVAAGCIRNATCPVVVLPDEHLKPLEPHEHRPARLADGVQHARQCDIGDVVAGDKRDRAVLAPAGHAAKD